MISKNWEEKVKEYEKRIVIERRKNPYDPTKPRIKDKNLRNAVKYLAKYMNIDKFYWDDDLKRLTGWDGGYIDFEKKCIGPCKETNGVMEPYHYSGRTYTVEELCYGYKDEE